MYSRETAGSTDVSERADQQATATEVAAYDDGRVLIDGSHLGTHGVVGGRGVIGVTGFSDPPSRPPLSGESITLRGTAALYSLDPQVGTGSWRVRAPGMLVGRGEGNLIDGAFGPWSGADPDRPHLLTILLTDGLGRTMTGELEVPAR